MSDTINCRTCRGTGRLRIWTADRMTNDVCITCAGTGRIQRDVPRRAKWTRGKRRSTP